MKSPGHRSKNARRRRFAEQSAFTLVEVFIASSCASLVIAGAMVFMNFARVSISGITAQAMVSDSAGHAIAFIQSRIRLATSVDTDAAGNTLILGFDDNYQVDSDGDGSPYNDKDHYEHFQFVGTNGTNANTASSNRIIYIPKVGVAGSTDLVRFGVRNLPGHKIFACPNPNTAIIRFGMVDPNGRDRFQSIDIQATGVALNRPASSKVVSIIP
jgi:Tfp pilus assembly protein PilW